MDHIISAAKVAIRTESALDPKRRENTMGTGTSGLLLSFYPNFGQAVI